MKQPCILGTDRVAGTQNSSKFSKIEKIDFFLDLKKALDCLNGTSEAISEKCDPVCNGSFAGDIRMESRVILNVDPAFVIYDDDKLENRDVFKSTCTYVSFLSKIFKSRFFSFSKIFIFQQWIFLYLDF